MESRDWIRDGLRAMAWAALSLVLAVLNLPLFVLFVVSLALTPVLGVGLVLVPLVTRLVRLRTGVTRALAARWGVPIERPYRAEPAHLPPVGPARYRWIVTDVATWRDLAWLLPGAVIGLGLGVLSLVLPAYGVEGIVLLPLWIWLGGGRAGGYGVIWPVHTVGEGFLSLPQGALILAVGLALAPALRRLDAQFAQLRLRVAELTVTRADTVDAQAAELRRIERDLHDGAQARLVSLGMAIGLAEEIVERDPAGARKLLAEARESSSIVLVELRHLVRGIHPPVLAERGLDGGVRALALHFPMPIQVDST